MNRLSGKDVDIIARLYEWSNRIDSLKSDTEDKDLTKMLIYRLLWVVTQD